jgi:hypothetical protein
MEAVYQEHFIQKNKNEQEMPNHQRYKWFCRRCDHTGFSNTSRAINHLWKYHKISFSIENDLNTEEEMIQQVDKYLRSTKRKTEEVRNSNDKKMKMLCRSTLENLHNDYVKEIKNYELEQKKSLVLENILKKLTSVEPEQLPQPQTTSHNTEEEEVASILLSLKNSK